MEAARNASRPVFDYDITLRTVSRGLDRKLMAPRNIGGEVCHFQCRDVHLQVVKAFDLNTDHYVCYENKIVTLYKVIF